ncbi:PfkB family carbohydrate kinase [Propionivibrio sp.]|uniref:PfkB family carbohydrate kinase n=1 Tax=Propionivibrio sp. TaxID=2212460 RepID=UPI0039E64BDD
MRRSRSWRRPCATCIRPTATAGARWPGSNGRTYAAPTAELDVYDRIGGGDGFAAGFFYGLLSGEQPEDALKLGWAHGALLTSFPGDVTMASLAEVRAFAQGGSARVQR